MAPDSAISSRPPRDCGPPAGQRSTPAVRGIRLGANGSAPTRRMHRQYGEWATG
ncbi:hypothetical protein ACFPM0_27400 [Pseudonocardia sulfidoxydans]|uniref:hypothetical protein n=1 Tax=Pseudonocardia sulfidoxydans TaxID=54011 RepID=UPI003620A415